LKTYFRLLSFAKPLGTFLAPFLITSLLASVFGVLNFALLIPLLNVLFDQVSPADVQKLLSQPAPTLSFDTSVTDFFQYYFAQFFREYGKLGALKYVCAIIVASVMLNNLFKYLSVRRLEAFKARMVSRLRETVFDRAVRLHLGFFSNERKGNLISRIMTDVQEVENSIANSLSAASKELFLLIAYLVTLFNISVSLTLFAFLVIPVSGIFISSLVRRMKRDAQEGQQRLSGILSILDETFGGMRVVKGFNAETFVLGKFPSGKRGLSNGSAVVGQSARAGFALFRIYGRNGGGWYFAVRRRAGFVGAVGVVGIGVYCLHRYFLAGYPAGQRYFQTPLAHRNGDWPRVSGSYS